MKRFLKIFSLVAISFILSGCFNDDKLANDTVYTTIYPIEYITSYLYGENKTVMSIYPNGADVKSYSLTSKQKETYSEGALFIYDGLTNEKELAREFRKLNKDILFIDATYGSKYNDSLEELWLSPKNFLKLAKNIKTDLLDYTTSKLISESIKVKYNELEEELSYMEADIRNIANLAKEEGTGTIITSSNKLNFLEKYGFEVINLSMTNLNESSIKSNFKNNKYKDIYLVNGDEKTTLISDLEKEYKANIIKVDTMYTLTDEQENNKENYLTIMKTFIDNIRNTTLS